MLLADLHKQYGQIEQIKNDMRSAVFRVVGISNGFSVVTYLIEDCSNLDISVLDDQFVETSLDQLPTEALLDYGQIKRQLDQFVAGEEYQVQDDPIAKEKFIQHFRKRRKGVNLYGIQDVDGNLL